MSDVKRYDLERVGPEFHSQMMMVEQTGGLAEYGEWVSAEDYDALELELVRAKSRAVPVSEHEVGKVLTESRDLRAQLTEAQRLLAERIEEVAALGIELDGVLVRESGYCPTCDQVMPACPRCEG